MVSEAKFNSINGKGLKKLTPKQMLQVKAQVKSDNKFWKLNEICQIIYSMYRERSY